MGGQGAALDSGPGRFPRRDRRVRSPRIERVPEQHLLHDSRHACFPTSESALAACDFPTSLPTVVLADRMPAARISFVAENRGNPIGNRGKKAT